MLCMGFIKELPEEERNLISSIYRFLGKKVVWDILKLLIENDGLTQDEIKKNLDRQNISNELNCMIDLGLITKNSKFLNNPMKRGWVYYIEDTNVNIQTSTLIHGYDLHYKNRFNDPKAVKRILRYYK